MDRRIRIRPRDGARQLYYSASGQGFRTYQQGPTGLMGDINTLTQWNPSKPLSALSPTAPNILSGVVRRGLGNINQTVSTAAQNIGGIASRFVGANSQAIQGVRNAVNNLGATGSNLISSANILEPLAATNGLVFPYTPTVTLSQSVDYSSYDPVHANQEIHTYTRTRAPMITLSGEFTVQNTAEAAYALAAIHFLRSVSKMSFSQNSLQPGTPPPVLLLSGYGEYMFNDLPIIIQSFNMNLPADVDYVQVPNSNTFLPTRFTLDVQMTVQNTPNQLRQFNLEAFRSGSLMKRGGWI